jgi:hypothetical protein
MLSDPTASQGCNLRLGARCGTAAPLWLNLSQLALMNARNSGSIASSLNHWSQ